MLDAHPLSPARSNTTVWTLRLFYFFHLGALGALWPFLPLICRARGLTPTQLASIVALVPASNLAIPPIWGAIADALRARVPLLRLATLGSALSVLLLVRPSGYLGTLVGFAVFACFRAPLTALADAAIYSTLAEDGVGYGRVRAWGSMGFACFVLALGLAGGSLRPERVIWLCAAIYGLATLVTLQLRAGALKHEPRVVPQALRLLRQPRMVLFVAGSALYFFAHAFYDVDFSLYVRDLGLGERFVGVSWFVAVAAEVLLMLSAPWLLERAGSERLLLVAAFAALVRWYLLSIVVAPAGLLLLQTLHAFTVGVGCPAMVHFLQSTAPEHLRAALQSIAWSLYGVGSLVGYFLAGRLYAGLGVQVFRLAAAGALVSLILYALVGALARRAHPAPVS